MTLNRYAVLVPNAIGGGAEHMAVTIATGLFEQGHDVELLCLNWQGSLVNHLPKEVRVVELGGRGGISLALRLARYLRLHPYTNILSVMRRTNIPLLVARMLSFTNNRCIITEASIPSLQIRDDRPWNRLLLTQLIRQLYPIADGIIAVSQSVADDLTTSFGIPQKEISVIYNPILRSSVIDKLRFPPEHSWLKDGTVPVIVSAGRLEHVKGFDVLLSAFAIALKYRKIRLLILGDGSLKPSLEQQISDLDLKDSVIMVGHVQNIFPYLAHASLFVSSSRYEGLGNVLVEALACGCPVISTDCAGGPREVLANGRFGTLVPVDDFELLASEIIDKLSRSPSQTHGLQEWLSNFTISTVLPRYLAILS